MEYIWNEFDADATKVVLTYNVNELGVISEIRICDNGTGIYFNDFVSSKK